MRSWVWVMLRRRGAHGSSISSILGTTSMPRPNADAITPGRICSPPRGRRGRDRPPAGIRAAARLPRREQHGLPRQPRRCRIQSNDPRLVGGGRGGAARPRAGYDRRAAGLLATVPEAAERRRVCRAVLAEIRGGGAEAKLVQLAVFNEELDRAGAPERLNIIGEDFAGPTIIEFGTRANSSATSDRSLTGEEIWCQLFSEPEAGSDLASLRTTADQSRWRVANPGPEDLDQPRPTGRSRDPARPHRRRTAASWDHLFPACHEQPGRDGPSPGAHAWRGRIQ